MSSNNDREGKVAGQLRDRRQAEAGQVQWTKRQASPDHFGANEGGSVTDKHVWVITGAGRGMGVDIARAALSAGHAVVATGRDTAAVAAALGGAAVGVSDDLLVV